jgi:Uma2 family endonuclease
LFPPHGEWTEEDYLHLPENRGVELADGCLEFLPMPTEAHQLILGYLYEALIAFVRPRGLGVVLVAGIPVRVQHGKMRQPDVVFMRHENRGRRGKQFWDGADLVVEVVSEGGRSRDLETKRGEYAAAGIPEYWIVDPARQVIEVLGEDSGVYQLRGQYPAGADAVSVVLPGSSVAVDAVFAAAE